MVNINMKGWKVDSPIPPYFLGEQGENNANILSIFVADDDIIEEDASHVNVKYSINIKDKEIDESVISKTKELTIIKETTETQKVDDEGNPMYDDQDNPIMESETKTYLQTRMTSDWLGKSTLKLLQVQLQYTDLTDSENPIDVVIRSNVFNAIVHDSV
jgi:predicted restriction endonuclease